MYRIKRDIRDHFAQINPRSPFGGDDGAVFAGPADAGTFGYGAVDQGTGVDHALQSRLRHALGDESLQLREPVAKHVMVVAPPRGARDDPPISPGSDRGGFGSFDGYATAMEMIDRGASKLKLGCTRFSISGSSKPDSKPFSLWRRRMSFSSVNGSAEVKPILSIPRDGAASTISCCSLRQSASVPAAGSETANPSHLSLSFAFVHFKALPAMANGHSTYSARPWMRLVGTAPNLRLSALAAAWRLSPITKMWPCPTRCRSKVSVLDGRICIRLLYLVAVYIKRTGSALHLVACNRDNPFNQKRMLR